MIKKKYFGTDGIRGKANSFPMDSRTMMNIAMAAGSYFTNGEHKHRVVIGKDTRLSGYMIENALTAGFIAAGMDVFLLGPVPTPAVSSLTKSLRADLGVMISASHNPWQDNGIKFFNKRGLKFDDEVELALEDMLENIEKIELVDSDKLGRAKRLDDVAGRYIETVKNTISRKINFEGLRVVIDCANGAGYDIAPKVLWEMGAEVIAIGNNPNGININDGCGSTDIALLKETVISNSADIGIALDGDADRIIACDENGDVLDGDEIMAAIVTYWKQQNRINNNVIVTTQMSNIAFENYLSSIGIKLIRTDVGDRYVLKEMLSNNYNIGGEQSGHIIFTDYCTTGDGLLAAIQLLAILASENKRASKSLRMFTKAPQILKNFASKTTPQDILDNILVKNAITAATEEIGSTGRVFVRKSGTENLLRVMVEGADSNSIESIADKIIEVMQKVDSNILAA